MADIHIRIKDLRKEKHYTLEQLAEKVKVSKQTIHRYETGEIVNIPYDKILLLADAFKVTPSYLMGWESENELDYEELPFDEYLLDVFNEQSKFIEDTELLNKSAKEFMYKLSIQFKDYNTFLTDLRYVYTVALKETIKYDEKNPDYNDGIVVDFIEYSYSKANGMKRIYQDHVTVSEYVFRSYLYKNLMIRLLVAELDDIMLHDFEKIRKILFGYENEKREMMLNRIIKEE